MRHLATRNLAAITLAIGALAATTGLAQAESRINIAGKSCASVQQTLINQGAAILRYPSKRTGATLYDRYVGDSRYCQSDEVGKWASVPTRDGQCTVIACKHFDPSDAPFGNRAFWIRPRLQLTVGR